MTDNKIQIAKTVIPQKELIELLEAWKHCRNSHTSGRPFYMLVQWVPIGSDNGGRIVCRQIMSPIKTQNTSHDV